MSKFGRGKLTPQILEMGRGTYPFLEEWASELANLLIIQI